MVDVIKGAKHYSFLEGRRGSFETLYLSKKIPLCIQEKLSCFFTRIEIVEKKEFLASTSSFCEENKSLQREETFYLSVRESKIFLSGSDYRGYLHGLVSLSYYLSTEDDSCFEIIDYPTLKHRALMLDVSRGKVFTLKALKNIINILCLSRYNALQFYIEHVFLFENLPEIGENSEGYSKDDILSLKEYASEHGIELEANLQLFGHCRRLLTRKEHSHLRESDYFWTLSPAEEGTYELIDKMLGEFLPLFDSEYVNICSDETYDLCSGNSKNSGKDKGLVYMNHILRVRDIALKYGKKIMVFGDIVLKHPELVSSLPQDIIFLDWLYDPKPYYDSTVEIGKRNKHFYVCPGTGAWNTLFPRLDGSITNISNFMRDGIENGADGLMLTDWNDHGGYAHNSFSHFSYVFAGLSSYQGKLVKDCDHYINWCTNEDCYSQIERLFAKIYNIPPMWSRNRSQCIIALFEEPIRGKSFLGLAPPDDFEAYNINMPSSLKGEYVKHKTNALRPIMEIAPKARCEIRIIISKIRELVGQIKNKTYKDAIEFTCNAFDLVCNKLDVSNEIVSLFSSKKITIEDIVYLEDKIRLLIRDFINLQFEFQKCWFNEARRSEIDEALINYSNIISRYNYLSKWLSSQRERLEDKLEVDYLFETYNDGSYNSLDTV